MLATSVKGHGQAETSPLQCGYQLRLFHLKTTQNCQVLDENGCLLSVNHVWLQTLGYSREEVIGRWFGDFMVSRDMGLFTKNFLCVGRTGEISMLVVRMVRKDGSIIVVSIKGIISLDDYGIFRQIHCRFEDITNFIRLNAEMEKAEEYFHPVGATLRLVK
jgi:PAS domain S-box-containing protein